MICTHSQQVYSYITCTHSHDLQAFFEAEIERRNNERDARLLAERVKQMEYDELNAKKRLQNLHTLCANLKVPVAAVGGRHARRGQGRGSTG